MALQKKVNNLQALGFGGQIAKGRDSYFQTTAGVAIDEKVKVGSFVQTTDKEGEFKGIGQAINGKIAGFVVFENFQNGVNDSDIINKGENITILTAGSAYLETSLQAKVGQVILIKNDDGSIVIDDDKNKGDHTFTGFIVEKGNATATSGVIVITTARAYM